MQTPEDCPSYPCNKCDLQFKTSPGLAVHSKSCQGKNSPSYPCKKCAQQFKTTSELAVHFTSCQGKKRKQCEGETPANFDMLHTCNQCDESFGLSSELDSHKMGNHNQKAVGLLNVWCNKCTETFSTYDDLRLHHSRNHEGSPSKKAKKNFEAQHIPLVPMKPKSVRFQNPDIDNQSLHLSLIKQAVGDNLITVTNEGRVTIPKNPAEQKTFAFKKMEQRESKEQMTTASAENEMDVITEEGRRDKNLSQQKSLVEFLRYNLPGHRVSNVKGDGACMPRAASVELSGTEDHFDLISRALNKRVLETLPDTRESRIYGVPVMVGNELCQHESFYFKDETDFGNFLGTNRSVYIWRGFHDFVAFTDLFGLPTDIFVVENGIVRNKLHVPVNPSKGFRIKHKLKLDRFTFANIDNNHFVAIVDPLENEDSKVIDGVLDELTHYVYGNQTEKLVSNQPNVIEGAISRSSLDEFIQKFEQLTVTVSKNESEVNNLKEGMKKKDQELSTIRVELNDAKNQIKTLQAEVETMRHVMSKSVKESSNFHLISKPAVTDSQVSYMDVVEPDDSLQNMHVITQHKQSGYKRVSPQASPQKKEIHACNVCKFEFKTRVALENHLPEHKQKVKFPCNVCKIEFDSRVHFEKHLETDMHMRNNTDNKTISKSPLNVQHKVQKEVNSVTPTPAMHGDKMFDGKTILKSPLNVNHVVQKDASANIPTMSQTRPSRPFGLVKRQYNCHVCSHQGTSSKNLQRHVRETSHKFHDDLSEKCFTCDMVCSNFEELMIHRKISHCFKFTKNFKCKP